MMDFTIQYLINLYPLIQVSWLNAAFAFFSTILLFPILFGRKSVQIKNYKVHFIRGILEMTTMLSAFLAFQTNPISTAYAFILMAPILTALLSTLVEKAKFTWLMWSCVVTAFSGVLIVLNPSYQSNFSLLFALVSALSNAVEIIYYRRMGNDENSSAFIVSTSFVVCLILFPWMIADFQPMSYQHFAMNMLSGFFLSVAAGSILYVLKFREVILAGTMQYTQIIWSILINFILYQTLPEAHVVLGSGLIAGSNILLIKLLNKNTPSTPLNPIHLRV